jgi:uncharacterized protein YbcV (DUF1398 family)
MFTVEQIKKAHEHVQTGADFPMYIRAIKQLGVTSFETWVTDSHTIYYGNDNYQTQSQPAYKALDIAAISDREPFIKYLKIHQQGETDYLTFCRHCAMTGIEKWIMDLQEMTCTYFDKTGAAILVEQIPG